VGLFISSSLSQHVFRNDLENTFLVSFETIFENIYLTGSKGEDLDLYVCVCTCTNDVSEVIKALHVSPPSNYLGDFAHYL
jgi:hypothetical protein